MRHASYVYRDFMHTAKYGGRIDMQRAASRENNSNAAGEATEKQLSLWEIDIYLQHIFKDRTYVNQPRLLRETGEMSVLKHTFASLDRVVCFYRSYLCLQRGYTYSANLGDEVSLPWQTYVMDLSRSLTLRAPQIRRRNLFALFLCDSFVTILRTKHCI